MATIVQQNGATAAHTPGRLIIGDDIACVGVGIPDFRETLVYGADDFSNVACVLGSSHDPVRRAANARRLVACWNALDGLSTAALEEVNGIGDLSKVALHFRDERNAAQDELNSVRASLAAAELLLAQRDATIADLRQRDSERVDIPLLTATELPGHGKAATGGGHD